jgi:hypothetical protein
MTTSVNEQDQEQQRHTYTFSVDDREYRVETPTITVCEIMDIASISREVGLLLLLEDGTQRTVAFEEIITLEKDPRFKKCPRFKRGQR